MAKVIKFYVPQGNPYSTSKYKIRRTKNGRRQAVAKYKGRNLYKIVSEDF